MRSGKHAAGEQEEEGEMKATQQPTILEDVVANSAMRALGLHANDRHVDGALYLDALKAEIRGGYRAMMGDLRDAWDTHMGDAIYNAIINTHCNAWAVKALSGEPAA